MFSNTAVRVIEVVCGLGGFAAVLAIGWLVLRPMMKPARPSYSGVGVEVLNSTKPGCVYTLAGDTGAEAANEALEWAAQQCDAAKYRADKYQFAEIAERIRAGKSQP